MKFKIRIIVYSVSISVLLSSGFSIAQNADLDAYRKITQMKDASEKIEALKIFRTEFPSSRYVSSSFLLSFSSFAQLGNVDSSLSYAVKFLNTIPEASRESAYNSIASQLAENKLALDIAKSYINKAVASARVNKSRALPVFLNTQASVYFNIGKIDSALVIQKEALASNDKNAGYLISLATYEEASGNRAAALRTISKSILMGRNDKAINYFTLWLEKENTDISDRNKLKENISKEIVDEYLKSDNSERAKSNAAAYLASLKIDLQMAEKLAKEAAININDKTSVDDIVFIRTNAALVFSALGDLKNTLNELLKAETFATGWDNDFWMLLGNTYEKLGQKEKALDAYLATKIVVNNDKVDQAVKALAGQLGLNDEAVTKKLDSAKQEMKEFEPGVYDKKRFGKKVVVAELFTGAECPPCVASDRAFDKLSEFYPREAVVILEYHVHIPGPDPMTNPDTHLKYVSYGGNFGTPTVFFDGVTQLIGGGPDYITKNRFNVYKYLIEKSARPSSTIKISGNAALSNNNVNLSLSVKPESKNDLTNCRIQIALVEKSINYKGSNGIDKHIFVVRDLVNGAVGISVSLTNEEQKIEQAIDITQIENSIKLYLDDPSKDPSWRMKTGFAGWKARPDNIDRKNLAVVVYIQNKETMQILEAKYFDVL